jgi:hypothetical protein
MYVAEHGGDLSCAWLGVLESQFISQTREFDGTTPPNGPDLLQTAPSSVSRNWFHLRPAPLSLNAGRAKKPAHPLTRYYVAGGVSSIGFIHNPELAPRRGAG